MSLCLKTELNSVFRGALGTCLPAQRFRLGLPAGAADMVVLLSAAIRDANSMSNQRFQGAGGRGARFEA